MATLNNASFPKQDGSTDALARVFWQAVHDALATTFGLSLTSDTGQANLATITRSGTTNDPRGYEIFKLGDALQATAPVFIKVVYMMGSATTNCTVGFQVGFATDGAGNIIGSNKSRPVTTALLGKLTQGNGSVDSSPRLAMGSGSTNRFCFAVGIDSTLPNENTGWVSLERSKDAAGADTGDGVIFAMGAGNAQAVYWLYLPASGAWQEESALTAIGSNNTSSVIGSVIGFGRPIPLNGGMKYPGKNLVCYIAADFSDTTEVSLTVDGGAVNYKSLVGANVSSVCGIGGMTKAANSRLALRFD